MVEPSVELLQPTARHPDVGAPLHQLDHVVKCTLVNFGVRVEHKDVWCIDMPKHPIDGDAETSVPIQHIELDTDEYVADHIRCTVGPGVIDEMDCYLPAAVGVRVQRPQGAPHVVH